MLKKSPNQTAEGNNRSDDVAIINAAPIAGLPTINGSSSVSASVRMNLMPFAARSKTGLATAR